MGKRDASALELRLGANLDKYLAKGNTQASVSKGTRLAVANKKAVTTVNQATVSRIKEAQYSVTLVKLEALAASMGIEAWELLHQSFDPDDRLLVFPASALRNATAASGKTGPGGGPDEANETRNISSKTVHRSSTMHEPSRDKRKTPTNTKSVPKTAKTAQNR